VVVAFSVQVLLHVAAHDSHLAFGGLMLVLVPIAAACLLRLRWCLTMSIHLCVCALAIATATSAVDDSSLRFVLQECVVCALPLAVAGGA